MSDRKIMLNTLPVIYKEGETSIKTFIHKKKCIYSQTPVEELLKEEGFELYDNVSKIEHMLINAENKKYTLLFKEITEDKYFSALGSVPPENRKSIFKGEIFRSSEYLTSNITSHYVAYKNRYFFANRRTTVLYSDIVQEIENNFFNKN